MDPSSTDAPFTLPVLNLKAETVGEVTLPAVIFGVPVRRHLVWEAVREIRAREHRGTHKTKVLRGPAQAEAVSRSTPVASKAAARRSTGTVARCTARRPAPTP
jgi:ribosomal protein L4